MTLGGIIILGLVVTVFMLGLAIGSWAMNRMLGRRSRRDLVKLELALAALSALLPIVLLGLGRIRSGAWAGASAEAVLALMTGLLAVLVGMEFPLAGKEDFQAVTATAARLYTADLVGACLGALLVSTFLIPLIGVIWVCLIAAAMNLISGAILRCTGKA